MTDFLRTGPQPEALAGTDSLDALMQKYQAEISVSANRVGLSGRARKGLTVVGGGILATAVVMGPPIAEGMTRGLSLPEAVVYAIGSLPMSGTWEHMEPETAKEIVVAISHSEPAQAIEALARELPKYGTDYRAILFEAGLLGGVVAGVERFFHRREKRAREIKEGGAGIKRKGEQLFVISGLSSNIADALTVADPDHIIPIYEESNGGKYLVSRLEDRTKKGLPIFLSLDINESAGITYRKSSAWNKIRIQEENLVHADGGRKYLVVIGCGEKAEEELTDKPEFIDVNQEEVHSTVDMLRKRLDKGVVVNDEDVVTVYLGSAKTPQIDDETGMLTTTDRAIAEKGGIKIYVDTWSTIVGQLKKQLVNQGIESAGIRLVSSVTPYRDLVEKLATELEIPLHTKDNDPGNATLFVYERISDETINKARRLKEENPDRKIIALTSNIEADESAKREGIATVCSATVIRDVIGAIKSGLKEGKTPEEIQKILDGNLKA